MKHFLFSVQMWLRIKQFIWGIYQPTYPVKCNWHLIAATKQIENLRREFTLILERNGAWKISFTTYTVTENYVQSLNKWTENLPSSFHFNLERNSAWQIELVRDHMAENGAQSFNTFVLITHTGSKKYKGLRLKTERERKKWSLGIIWHKWSDPAPPALSKWTAQGWGPCPSDQAASLKHSLMEPTFATTLDSWESTWMIPEKVTRQRKHKPTPKIGLSRKHVKCTWLNQVFTQTCWVQVKAER